MFQQQVMQALVLESIKQNARTKKAIVKVSKSDPKYEELDKMHLDLVVKAVKNVS